MGLEQAFMPVLVFLLVCGLRSVPSANVQAVWIWMGRSHEKGRVWRLL